MAITAAQLVEKVREVAAELPANSLDSGMGCFYFYDNGNPCCIVGQAMSRLGVTPAAALEELEESYIHVPNPNQIAKDNFDFEFNTKRINTVLASRKFAGLFEYPDSTYDSDVTWLRNVQARQDDGFSWAEAVAWADSVNSLPDDDLV